MTSTPSVRGTRLWSALSDTAPILGLAVMLLMPAVLTHGSSRSTELEQRLRRVNEAVDSAPYRIGEWIGTDVDIPRAAIEILQPTAILSRQFQHLETGASATLLVVHCEDARDMQGHYPPVCYPANGWILPNDGTRRVDVPGVGLATVYDFQRLDELGGRRRLRVLNLFVLPDGTIGEDITAISRLARRHDLSIRGVAQVQVAMDGNVKASDGEVAAHELLEGVGDLLAVLADRDANTGVGERAQ